MSDNVFAPRPEAQADPRLAANPILTSFVLDHPEGAARLAYWQGATQGARCDSPDLELVLAEDILALFPHEPVEKLAALRGAMLSRAASTLRARATLRLANGPENAEIRVTRAVWPWRGFFTLALRFFQHARFDGRGLSPELRREVFVSTDAVTVLPYDPVRDEVLFVEQFRMGPWARGEARPWLLEPIAGRIDPGESADEAARREAYEEAGVTLDAIFAIAEYYPSPGALSEYLYSRVALADLSAVEPGLYGLASEGEDIRTHIIPFETALDWAREGRMANGPALLSLLWLERERAQLRRDYAQG